MGGTRSGVGPDQGDTASWTSETLPLSVRKELLERELRKLGFHKDAQAGTHNGGTGQQQPQPQGSSSHPSAEADADSVSHAG